MSTDIFINDFLKHAFGMQDLAQQVARVRQTSQSFPPYNISVDDVEHPTSYLLEIAVAGFSKEDITVKIVKENGVSLLVVRGEKQPTTEVKKFVVQGLANRSFRREFTMADSIKVDDVALKDGVITIKMSSQEVLERETVLQIQ